MNLYFDKKGAPILFTEWARLVRNDDYRRVALTVIPGVADVSTVWLGLNHGLSHDRPLIFETMAFNPAGEVLECSRYSTELEARAGHAEMTAEFARGPK